MSTALVLSVFLAGQCGPNGCTPQPVQYYPAYPVQVQQPVAQPITADDDGRLFERLKPRLLELIEKRAAERVAEELQAAADEINSGVAVADMRGHKSIAGMILATAIAALVKKIVYAIIVAAIGAVLVQLLWSKWLTILLTVVGTVAFIAFPAGWLGGRTARPRGQ